MNIKNGDDDVMPEADVEETGAIDPAEPASALAPREVDRDEPAPSGGEQGPIELGHDAARARVYQRAKEIRDAEAKAWAERGNAPESPDTSPDPSSEAGTEATNANSNEQQIELLVDGEIRRVSLAEARKLAQIAAASDKRLEESKRLLAEARSVVAEARGVRQDAHRGPLEGEYDHSSDPREARLRQIAEKLQVGDLDEAAQAIREIAVDPSEIDRRVEQRLRMSRVEEENRRALQAFIGEFPDVAQNRHLTRAAEGVFMELAAEELRRAGVDENLIAQAQGDFGKLTGGYNHVRAVGAPVRSTGELLREVGKTLRNEFKLSPKASTPRAGVPPRVIVDPAKAQERIDRKRAATPQPRSVGIRAQTQQAPRPLTTQEKIRQIRQARGFPTNT